MQLLVTLSDKAGIWYTKKKLLSVGYDSLKASDCSSYIHGLGFLYVTDN